jgi:uncharacterized protein (TIGR02646 family)
MRRISKLRPPVDISPDGQIPRSFGAAEREYLATLKDQKLNKTHARSEFDKLDKLKLRAVMFREQRSICVFCEREIREGYPEPRIDHWKPLSTNHELALNWKNLYLSCPTEGTCDDAKGDRLLRCEESDSDLPCPSDYAYENILGFTSDGRIFIRSDVKIDDSFRRSLALAIEPQHRAAGGRLAILNLNHRVLIAARIAAIDGERERMAREFVRRHATGRDREQRVAALLKMDPFLPFLSVRIAWLRKFPGRERT